MLPWYPGTSSRCQGGRQERNWECNPHMFVTAGFGSYCLISATCNFSHHDQGAATFAPRVGLFPLTSIQAAINQVQGMLNPHPTALNLVQLSSTILCLLAFVSWVCAAAGSLHQPRVAAGSKALQSVLSLQLFWSQTGASKTARIQTGRC